MDIELWGLMPVTCYFSIIGFGSLNCQGTCICWTKEQNYYYYYFLKTKEVATWESEPCDFDDLHLQNCSRIWIFYDIHYIREPSQPSHVQRENNVNRVCNAIPFNQRRYYRSTRISSPLLSFFLFFCKSFYVQNLLIRSNMYLHRNNLLFPWTH